MSVCNFFGCNEDIFVNILNFANITHYVELIYTYHTTTYLYLPSMLCAWHARYMLVTCMLDACNMHVTCFVKRPKTLMLHETCMLHECRKQLQHSFNMHVALRMLLSVRCM